MSRRHRAEKREVLPDAKYGSLFVTKFINGLMVEGKKSAAEHIVYGAFDILREKTNRNPIELFEEAMDNIMPLVEVRSRRVGGATYQVPMEVRPERRRALAIRWAVNASRSRSERTMRQRVAMELLDASNKRGNAVKKREDTHRMADANKAFSHFRW
ncbi:MAG: 30S ribosomal protein S7 [Alphaproteobacteria bacterium]|nr:MAG: 30S ribosomal protein S7 [Alphaproteobacteria bacterium]TAE82337.1 MAG: 30S ribosomal protein S7 [Alphaproteobacteria bacterium]TAF14715.1 MAG: 30S ribosomal protein S7 [Alphaproteobacteria bacterium]TAF38883.1 MAG: 30S ribosomal protein S7 [Alphaproteobacteria bacterium]TAF75186.1 MAG: 30S ribosomal protein S7 [Alphaproteobacteria bacterium]